MLVEISLKVVYSNTCGKSYQIDGVRIPKKCIESIHFYSCDLPPHLKLVPSSYHHTLGRRKSLIPAGSLGYLYFECFVIFSILTYSHAQIEQTYNYKQN